MPSPESDERIGQVNSVLAAFADTYARQCGHEECANANALSEYCTECRSMLFVVMFHLGRVDAIKTMKKAIREVADAAQGRHVKWGPNIFEGIADGAMVGTREAMPEALDEFLTLLFEVMDANGGNPVAAADAVRMAAGEAFRLPGIGV